MHPRPIAGHDALRQLSQQLLDLHRLFTTVLLQICNYLTSSNLINFNNEILLNLYNLTRLFVKVNNQPHNCNNSFLENIFATLTRCRPNGTYHYWPAIACCPLMRVLQTMTDASDR